MASTPDTSDPRHIPWWRRVRSAVLLVALSATLGVATGALIGLTVVTLFSLLDHALG